MKVKEESDVILDLINHLNEFGIEMGIAPETFMISLL